MHNHLVNASIQVLPVAQDRHPYLWVDEAIAIIQASGIKYNVGPFATVLEGHYEEVIQVVHRVNDHLQSRGCTEWVINFQLQVRADSDITGDEKTTRYNQ